MKKKQERENFLFSMTIFRPLFQQNVNVKRFNLPASEIKDSIRADDTTSNIILKIGQKLRIRQQFASCFLCSSNELH